MSWREHWTPIRSSVVEGDVISGCRDDESRTYRLFVNKGWRDVRIGSSSAHQIESCDCCDLSVEDLRRLSQMLTAVVAAHEPWPDPEAEE